MREIDVVFDPERKLFLYFGVAFMAILVGPFGTYELMSFWERAVFWTLDVLGGLLIIVPILHVFYYSRLAAFIPSFPRFLIGVAIGAVPTAAYITVLFGTVGQKLEISTEFPLLLMQVTVFSTLLLLTEFVLWPMVFGPHKGSPAGMNVPGTTDEPKTACASTSAALLSRLPDEHAGAQVVSISMQDHYAEVTTTQGAALILMRLGDAIDLMEGCPGARIHRSHWVAGEFVKGIEKTGRKTEVRMRDGRRLPIGNTYLKAAQQQLGIGPGEDAV
ncbi:LytTR family DNA-binding domain-containing protein [Alisedimentitalea sp. MJ-SS2]|uniref:LytTR family DNA-binding domain-containing protein n=1 Tax=Aliisedimentitalea sp. MJ-SS2 TaxID=3049795 RepID=UPI002908E2CA|nr:LytTR family DNA-binding domain-containing protein [Alisedimentitalea sp. MJ-SS2]MDU8927085.1 LytTR family DNA-binding domain-containing protein [Alisedimentitalea sp. MJ-SS2]